MQKRACCRFPLLFLEAARGKFRLQKQDAKTLLIWFSHIVSGGCCGNPLVIGAISCFLAPGNDMGKRARLRFPILFLGVYIRRYFGDVWGGIKYRKNDFGGYGNQFFAY